MQRLARRFGMLAVAVGLAAATGGPAAAEPAAGLPDFGDAPDSNNSFGVAMPLYPGGPPAQFPTNFQLGVVPTGAYHQNSGGPVYVLGSAISAEQQADSGWDSDGPNNIKPLGPTADLDGGDDGLSLPPKFAPCDTTKLVYKVTVFFTGSTRAYLNLWSDWDSNGKWGDRLPCGAGRVADEWLVQNKPVTLTGPGTFTFVTPSFTSMGPTGKPQWIRITLSEAPNATRDGRGPGSGWQIGETEDYQR
ncbi:MAG TPA: GEVED domain-containing protein, partial [Herpetosiphonaceae bacterium]